MINEEMTFKLFGYTSFNIVTNVPKPFVRRCDGCGKNEIFQHIYGVSDMCRVCRTEESWECADDRREELSKNNPFRRHDVVSSVVDRMIGNNPMKDPIIAAKAGRMNSARCQGITYDEWESHASGEYCPAFNEECRESNREKYGRMCFLCGLPEEENVTKNSKQVKLSVHHYDMDKEQGCDGKQWKLVPLCMKHHANAHNETWEARIEWLLKNIEYNYGVIEDDAQETM